MRVVVALLSASGALLAYVGLTSSSVSRGIAPSAIDKLVAEADVRGLTGPRLVLGIVAVGALTLVAAAGVTASFVVSIALGVAASWLPVAVLRSRRRRRLRRFQEAWPDAIATLIASVRAGVSLSEACAALTSRGPRELSGGFEAFASTYRATGSFKSGLEGLRSSLSDPIADRVVAALSIAHEVGGTDLVRMLRALGDFVRADLHVRKEIEARWSWTITAARVAAAAPWIVLLLMSTRPEAASAFNSPTGAMVVAIGGAVTLLGYRLMLKAATLPQERRIGA